MRRSPRRLLAALVASGATAAVACGYDGHASGVLIATDASFGGDVVTRDGGSDGATDAGCGACVPKTCATILAADPAAKSGVYTIDPDESGGGAPFSAYCDMLDDGGGWTLLITLTSKTVTFANVAAWPTTIATTAGPPDTTGMYKGSLAAFSEVREEVASGKVKVWGKGKTVAQLEVIRSLYGHQSRLVAAPRYGDVPSCRLAYATPTDNLESCTRYDRNGSNTGTLIGWTVDPTTTFGFSCWFARGNCCSVLGGSSLCIEAPNGVNGEPNGTAWARTWFR